jgi:hypothetical protein
VHGNSPIWLDHGLINLWENNLAVWADEIVMTLVHVLADDIDMEEGLLDQCFHSLVINVSLYFFLSFFSPSK